MKLPVVVAALLLVGLIHVAFSADNAVVPIDWSRFTISSSDDANVELRKAISKNTIKFALNGWYAERYGAQSAEAYYLDVFDVPGPKNAEFQIRGSGMQAQGIATVVKLGLYDAAYTGVSEETALDICAKLVRSVAFHHRVNKDGGWGGGWQDDFWAAITGQAGWLTWELHNDQDRELIRKMVEWEANRRMNYIVPYFRKKDGTVVTPGDTKAEENAWNSNVLFLGCAMMPGHENYDKWYKKAVELVISAYSHPNDVDSDTIVNGRPLKEWLNGSNTEDNYAVINHSIVHPCYSTSSTLNLWNASILTLGGKPTPEGVFFNLDKVYRALVEWEYLSPPYAEPGGTIYRPGNPEFYFPQGNSWGPARYYDHSSFGAVIHAYGLDAGLSRNGAYWEELYARRALELQSRFDYGRMFTPDAQENKYMCKEEQKSHLNALAIWANWTISQPDFKITKDAPKP